MNIINDTQHIIDLKQFKRFNNELHSSYSKINGYLRKLDASSKAEFSNHEFGVIKEILKSLAEAIHSSYCCLKKQNIYFWHGYNSLDNIRVTLITENKKYKELFGTAISSGIGFDENQNIYYDHCNSFWFNAVLDPDLLNKFIGIGA